MNKLTSELMKVVEELDSSFNTLGKYEIPITEMFPALSHRSITVNGKQYFVKMNIELEEM